MSRLFPFIHQITYLSLSVNRRLFVCKQTLSSAKENTPGSCGAPSSPNSGKAKPWSRTPSRTDFSPLAVLR
jgi:hypothetical protein